MKLALHSLAVLICSLPSLAFQSPQPKAAQTHAISISPGHSKTIPPGQQGSMFVQSNDNCSGAQAISGSGPHSFDNSFATTDGCPNCQPCGLLQRDVWFNWTASSTGTWTFSLCGGGASFDPVIAVYNGNSCPPAPAIACNDDFCGLISEVSFTATVGNIRKLQIGSFSTSPGGPGTFTLTTAVPPLNDGCTSPTVIAGQGPHPFNNTTATTGVQGQTEGVCFASGTTAIGKDVWFLWTAGSTGLAQLTTCGLTTVDTKIAVYLGAACPASAAVGCNDDACGLQSAVCFAVTSGQTYMIQLGSFPGAAGGTGTFSIPINPPPPFGQHDDGSSENLFGWFAGGELVWMQRFSGTGSTGVSSIQVTWGSLAFPGLGPGNGTSSKVAIWDDPNDDGNPSDAVLIQLVNTTVSNVDTDIFNTVPIAPVVVNGVFFLGAGLAHASGQFVAPMDESCPIAGVSWYFGNNNATPVDYSNVQNNVFPPASFALSGFPAIVMVRGGLAAFANSTFCEPGLNGVISCPCGNPPSGPGRGCNNSSNTGGATLSETGAASLSSDTLVFTTTGEKPVSLSIVLQGTTEIVSGVPYGDGVRCLGGVLKRLYTKNAVGGSITAPQGGDPSVSARSAALGHPIPAGQLRYYMVYYRDGQPFACPGPGSATFNTSSSKRIYWVL
ncbi:MAG: hypothetical protein ACKVXR_10165 [Planctomycetota bacterium]